MHMWLWFVCLLLCLGALMVGAQDIANDPVFNFDKIEHDPLDAKVLKSTQEGNVIIEEVEYIAEVYRGKPVRIFGVLAYPKGGKQLPCIFWSQGGMYEAGTYWPRIWATKGYLCLNVTLPHEIYNSFTRFTTERPEDGNLAHLAVAQMRGITYLTQRPEADPMRVGVGGSSYGGFFASLIAGADARVKAGMSFFTTGNHKLGTGYPQFLQLRTTDEVGIWGGTIDPAWRLKVNPVPFLWAVAANDHWCHLPAAIKTYQDAAVPEFSDIAPDSEKKPAGKDVAKPDDLAPRTDKRLAIAPNWYHAFPANVDQELIDWFDVYLQHSRQPYNEPYGLAVKASNGKVTANWSWRGSNLVKKAELIVAYGRTRPWHDGWLFRYHYVIPAKIDEQNASAEIPVPERGMEMYVYGNITDHRGVLTSTEPMTVKPDTLGNVRLSKLALNTALLSDFSPYEIEFMARHGDTPKGKFDKEIKQGGGQSLRIDPAAHDDPQPVVSMKLGHIPGHSHKLTLWLRANKPTTLRVAVTAATPSGWQFRIVDILRRQYPDSPDMSYDDIVPPVYTTDTPAAPAWQQVTLDCPVNEMPVEGYTLTVTQPDGDATYWIDTISFTPQWNTK